MNSGRSVCGMIPIIVSFVSFIVVAAINALSAQGPISGLFNSNQANLSAKYNTGITPAGWTFSIWGFIYAWQALHLIYSLTLICRRTESTYLYIKPNPAGTLFYIFYIVSGLMNIGWIFSFDQEVLWLAGIFLLLIAGSLYICLIFSHRALFLAGAALESSGSVKDIWLTRLLIHNGVAFYCAWTNVASMLNLVIFMHYTCGVDMGTSSWVAYGILNAVIIGIFVLEIFFFDKYVRYTFAHYITLVVAFSGILYQNYSADSPQAKYCIALLVLSAVLGVVKVVVLLVRARLTPIRYDDWADTGSVSYTNSRVNFA